MDKLSEHPIFELVKLPTAFRHETPGYFALHDLPQQKPVDSIAVSTGWPDLDEIWKLYPTQFTVCTGLPGHGKSTLLLNVICNVARKHGMRSFLYVPENEIFVRDKLRAIWESPRGFDEFCRNQCYIQSAMPNRWDDAPRTLQWVLEHAAVAVDKDNVDLLLIDPWNELEHAKPRDLSMTDYIRTCLMYLKSFCRAMRCMVILVAHPTKEGVKEGKTPTLADIEGSMAWYNKCDNGLIVVRDPDNSTTRVISAKARERGAGRRGQCFFHVNKDTGLFTPQYVERG